MEAVSNTARHLAPPGNKNHSRLPNQGRAIEWKAAGGIRNDQDPCPIHSVAVVDTHWLSAECLKLLIEEHAPDVTVSIYNDPLSYLEAVEADPDVLVLNIHCALHPMDHAVEAVEQIADACFRTLLVTLADFDELQSQAAILRLRTAGSDRVLSSRSATPEDVLVAIGLRGSTTSAAAGTTHRTESFGHVLQGKRVRFGRVHPQGL